MAEQLPSRMSVELSLAGGEPVEVYDRAVLPVPGRLARSIDWFNALPPVLRGFLKSVSEDRLDDTTLGAFADWLEERGQTEAGQRVRLLRPQPGDVLVMWPEVPFPGMNAYTDWIDTVRRIGKALGLQFVAMGNPDQRIEAIDPEQLRAAGWVRECECEERVRAEREACARVVETEAAWWGPESSANAIRSRLGD